MRNLRVRIKDRHAKALDALACECNMVWNFVNELSYKHLQRTGKFFSAYDIAKYTSGANKEGLKVHSQTVQGVTEEYVSRRKQFKKARLRWRVSRGARKSLGWIPFKVGALTYKNGNFAMQVNSSIYGTATALPATSSAQAVSIRMREAAGMPMSASKSRNRSLKVHPRSVSTLA